MVINNVLLRLKERKNEDIEKARQVLLGMKGKIETLRDIQVEVDIRHGEYDIILITKFNSMEDLEAYLVNPVHLEVGKYIGSVVESQASLCYESLN